MEANLPGLDLANAFFYGQPGQIERHLKSKTGLIEWVGVTREYKNNMTVYLNKREEPEFTEPEMPTPEEEGKPIHRGARKTQDEF